MTTETNTQEIINTNLQNALSVFINKTIEGVDASVEFLQQEIPDVVYQLILWYGIKSAVTALFAVIGLILLLIILLKGFKSIKENYKALGDEFLAFGGIFIGIPTASMWLYSVSLVVSVLYHNSITALQIWVTPKIWLLEYAGSFIK